MPILPGTFKSGTAVRPVSDGDGLRLFGSSSGYVGLFPAAAAGSVDFTLPTADGTNGQVLQTNGSGVWSFADQSSGVTDHGALTGLTDDDHAGYARLAGRTGSAGQILIGGQDAGDDLILIGTSHATKGSVHIGGGTGGGANPILTIDDATETVSTRVTPTAASHVVRKDYVDAAVTKKNYIINGDFDIAQAGTTFTAVAAGAKTLDMWSYTKTGSSAVHTISQNTDVPTAAESGHKSNYSLLVDCTTADTSVAVSDIVAVEHRMEGYDFQQIAHQAVVISFWHKHTKTGVYCVAFSSGDISRSCVGEYTQSVSDTWEKSTITFPASPTSGGTWSYTTGVGLRIWFILMAGSNFSTTAGAWVTSGDLKTTSQVNSCDSTSNNFRLAQVKLEVGTVESNFTKDIFQVELRKCQRFYEKSYEYATAAGTATTSGSQAMITIDTFLAYNGVVQQMVEKATTPSVSIYNTQNGTVNQFSKYDTGDTFQSNQTGQAYLVGTKIFSFYGSGGATADYFVKFHWVSDARL